MKTDNKILALLVMVLCSWSGALAWHEYRPMIVEGRRWDCLPTTYTIKGNTLIDGLSYKKAMAFATADASEPWQYVGAVREYDRKVDIIFKDSTNVEQLCDFSQGYVNDYGSYIIGACNMIFSEQERRSIDIALYPVTGFYTLLEGVGYLTKPFDFPWHYPGIVTKCYDGDTVIYDHNESGVIVLDGEINGDGTVDVGDVNAVISMVLRRPMRPGWDDVAADMDQNATLDAGDANALISIILGK